MPETVLIERSGAIARLTFNRPDVRNAVNYKMADETQEALAALNADPACKAIVITGAGEKAFCAGMDIQLLQGFDAAGAADWMDRLRAFYQSIRALDKPCIAAVNGVAAGAGYQAALVADIRVGHAGARMGQTEINVGLPSIVGAHIMSAQLGHMRTVELTLSGRLMDGEEAFRLGLFHHLVPADEVLAKAYEAAEELAAKPPMAMKLTKQRLREVTQPGFDAAIEAGKRLQAEAFATGEPQAVAAAFFKRRK